MDRVRRDSLRPYSHHPSVGLGAGMALAHGEAGMTPCPHERPHKGLPRPYPCHAGTERMFIPDPERPNHTARRRLVVDTVAGMSRYKWWVLPSVLR